MSSSPTEPRVAASAAPADGPPGGGSDVAGARTVDVLMPRMGTSVAEGTIVAWRVAPGDRVGRDEVVCEVSTDKVDVECPAPVTGVVAEILVQDGETVDVGTVIARLVPPGAAVDGAVGPASSGGATPARQAEPRDAAPPVVPALPGDPRAARREALRRSSPVAARLAAEHGIDVRSLAGSGRGGRVTKRDVLAAAGARDGPGSEGAPRDVAADGPPAAPADAPMHTESPYRPDPSIPTLGADRATRTRPEGGPAPGELGGVPVPASRMRRAIGEAVRRSLDTAAHCTTVVECDMGRVERERRELGITALPLVARATVRTLREFPALNATTDGETVVRYGDRVHLGIAVSLGEDGLIAPVIHDAQDLSAQGLARRIADLAARARSGDLHPDEVRGGTFTITNPGAAGALIATPVINQPQVAILDLEAIVRRPVVLTDADGGESIGIRPMVHLCLGWDHRALDGLYAAQFLTALRRRLEG